MKTYTDIQMVHPEQYAFLSTLSPNVMDRVIETAQMVMAHNLAKRITKAFNVETAINLPDGTLLSCPFVFNPNKKINENGHRDGTFATVGELKRLWDMLVNLDPQVAYDRWIERIEPVSYSFSTNMVGDIFGPMDFELSASLAF